MFGEHRQVTLQFPDYFCIIDKFWVARISFKSYCDLTSGLSSGQLSYRSYSMEETDAAES